MSNSITKGNSFELLGAELRRLRMSQFFMQREFSRLLRIHRSTYNGWETGRRFPSPEGMRKVLEYYKEKGVDTSILERLYVDADLSRG